MVLQATESYTLHRRPYGCVRNRGRAPVCVRSRAGRRRNYDWREPLVPQLRSLLVTSSPFSLHDVVALQTGGHRFGELDVHNVRTLGYLATSRGHLHINI